MSQELPQEFIDELKAAIAAAIRGSPHVRRLMAEAAQQGTELELALVVGVLTSGPHRELLSQLQQLMSQMPLDEIDDEDEPTEPLDRPHGGRRKLRLQITSEDRRFFKQLGLRF